MITHTTTRKQGKILIVEDERSLRETLKDIFEQKEYEVIVAENGNQALTIAHESQPDVIITDISMPVMDGYEFVERFSESRLASSVPIIMLTAKVSETDKIRGLNLGSG